MLETSACETLRNFGDRGVGHGDQNAAGNAGDGLQGERFHSTHKIGGYARALWIAGGDPAKRCSSLPQHPAKR